MTIHPEQISNIKIQLKKLGAEFLYRRDQQNRQYLILKKENDEAERLIRFFLPTAKITNGNKKQKSFRLNPTQ